MAQQGTVVQVTVVTWEHKGNNENVTAIILLLVLSLSSSVHVIGVSM